MAADVRIQQYPTKLALGNNDYFLIADASDVDVNGWLKYKKVLAEDLPTIVTTAEDITIAQIQSRRAASDLTIGKFYRITNSASGVSPLFVQAVGVNAVSYQAFDAANPLTTINYNVLTDTIRWSLNETNAPINLNSLSALTPLSYNNTTGQFSIDLTDYVPYIGATSDLDLGLFDIYASNYRMYDVANDAYGKMELYDGRLNFQNIDGQEFFSAEIGTIAIRTETISAGFDIFSLTANRSYTLPNASGTLALTSDLSGYISGTLSDNYVPVATGANTITNSHITDNGSVIKINDNATDNGLLIDIPNDIVYLTNTTSNNGFVADGTVVKTVDSGADRGLYMDFATQDYKLGGGISNYPNIRIYNGEVVIGDVFEGNYQTKLIINDDNQIIKTTNQGNESGIIFDFPNQIYKFGTTGNGLEINNGSLLTRTYFEGDEHGIYLDGGNGVYKFGVNPSNGIQSSNNGDLLKTLYQNNDIGLLLNFGTNQHRLYNNNGLGLVILSNNDVYIGDPDGFANSIYLQIDNTNQRISTTNNSLYLDYVINQTRIKNNNLGLDIFNSVLYLGDIDGTNNTTTITIDDNSQIIKTSSANDDRGLYLDFYNEIYSFGQGTRGLLVDVGNNNYQLGDYDDNNNFTYLKIDDLNLQIQTSQGGQYRGLILDFDGNSYYLGDANTTINGTFIGVVDDNKRINLKTNRTNFRNLTTTAINALTGNQESDLTYNSTLHSFVYYNGTAWTQFGNVTGSGTTNYLPKFTGASSLGNSLFYSDSDLAKTVYSGNDVGLYISFGDNYYALGDGNLTNNGTTFIIDDANQVIATQNQGAYKGLSLGFLSKTYQFWDGARGLSVSNNDFECILGDFTIDNTGTLLKINDNTQVIKTQNQGADKGLYIDFTAYDGNTNIAIPNLGNGSYLQFPNLVNSYVYNEDTNQYYKNHNFYSTDGKSFMQFGQLTDTTSDGGAQLYIKLDKGTWQTQSSSLLWSNEEGFGLNSYTQISLTSHNLYLETLCYLQLGDGNGSLYFNNSNLGNVMSLDFNSTSQTITTISNGSLKGLSLDFANRTYYLGDYNYNGNGCALKINDSASVVNLNVNGGNGGISLDGSNNIYKIGQGDGGLDNSPAYGLTIENGNIQLGDGWGAYNNIQVLKIDSLNSITKTQYNGNDKGFILDFENNFYLFGNRDNVPNQLAIVGNELVLGDCFNNVNSTKFIVDDSVQIIKTSGVGQDKGLYLDFAYLTYQLGDWNGNNNGTTFLVDDTNGLIKTLSNGQQVGLYLDLPNRNYSLGDWNGNNNGTYFYVNDNTSIIYAKGNGQNKGLYIDFNNDTFILGKPAADDWNEDTDGFSYRDSYTLIGSSVTHAAYIQISHGESRTYLETNRVYYRNLTTTQINALTSNLEGDVVYNTTLNTLCFYNGANWQRCVHLAM
jgi:hypothetical protein